MEMAIVIVALIALLAVLFGTWRRGRRRQQELRSRMEQDLHSFHEQLHRKPGHRRSGRYQGPGQGWR